MNFCKRILSVIRSAINVVILSELGRTPLCIRGLSRAIIMYISSTKIL